MGAQGIKFYYKVRKDLGFTRLEWDALSFIDQRLYIEGMQWARYDEEFGNWKSGGQKGPPPKSPDELKRMQPVSYEDKKESEIAPDIEDMLFM
jgi:hypothetical protein